jgi:hypothetical protein
MSEFRSSPGHHNQAPLSRTASAKEIIRTELSVVFKAGEHHPKNYYAFSYMRQFLATFIRALTDSHNADKMPAEAPALKPVKSDSLMLVQSLPGMVVDETHSWCLAHPRDISGWTFLLHLLEATSDETAQRRLIKETVQFALDVGWEGESLWVFVDLAMMKFGIEFGQITVPDGNTSRDNKLGERGDAGDTVVLRRRWKQTATRAKGCRLQGQEADDDRILPLELGGGGG